MNAQELFAYHFAVGNTGTSRCRFVTTDQEVDDIKAGIERVGGDPARCDIHKIPVKKSWDLPPPAEGARYVLDSFTSWSDEIGWDASLEALKKLRDTLRETQEVGLISVVNGIHEPHQIARLKMWADGVLELGFDRQGFGLYPFLKVTKMRGVADSARFLLFKDTAKGLFMESTRRVF